MVQIALSDALDDYRGRLRARPVWVSALERNFPPAARAALTDAG
jgi:hypothetical protein